MPTSGLVFNNTTNNLPYIHRNSTHDWPICQRRLLLAYSVRVIFHQYIELVDGYLIFKKREEGVCYIGKKVLTGVIILLQGSPTCFCTASKSFTPFVIFCAGDAALHITPGNLSIYHAIIRLNIRYYCLTDIIKDTGRELHHKHRLSQFKYSCVVKITL